MFDQLLIANRGAIACRILRSLREMNVRGVAVYSDADISSLHIQDADEAISLGEGAAVRTYLDVDKILSAARRSGAQAIHLGYGFLSENAAFAETCEAAQIAFVGPTPQQLRVFGLKHTARALAKQHNVPLLEGTELLENIDVALGAAATIGYPVMLKSTAGGGGIGMRVCYSATELSDAFETVKRLGQNNFSDAGVFIEKYIERARHLEVQIFGDGQGYVMGLGDVYLGAPVATPLDPRHRLITTKYNPARTWTAENSVGIGGAYLCVYGMEGPGGYQFVGRTLQMWDRYRGVGAFDGKPWLLRFFDQIRFYPVSADELLSI